jgi:hypothetical protein
VGEMIQTKASVVAAFDARLLQYKTVLQSRIDREQIRQSFQLFLGRFWSPPNCTTPPDHQLNDPKVRRFGCGRGSTSACHSLVIHPQFEQINAWGNS